MSIIYCEKHGNQWDSDKKDHGCYVCDSEETEQEQRERIEKEHGSLSPEMMEHLGARMNARKFRKKPVVIDAVRWDGTEAGLSIVLPFIQDGHDNFDHLPRAPDDPHIHQGIGYTPSDGCLYIPTLEGIMTGRPGDWIIRGVKGEFYPVKPDIFAETYELATCPPA